MSILFINCDDTSQLVNVLKTEISKLAESYPYGHEVLIRNLQVKSEFLVTSVIHSQLEATLKYRYGISDEIVQKFMGIAFSQSLLMQSFTLVLQKHDGYLDEHIGVAYNDNYVIRLAYIKVHADGTLVPKYTKPTERFCAMYTTMFDDCNNEDNLITRGYTVDEVITIFQALRAIAYGHLLLKIENLDNSSQFVLLQEQRYYSVSQEYYFVLQADGNFVAYQRFNGGDFPIWSAGSYQSIDNSPYSFHLKFDGSMEIRGRNHFLHWLSGTGGKGEGPHLLLMQEDGNLVLYDSNRRPLWDINNKLALKDFVLPQESLFFSTTGKCFAIMQKDGNFVVYSVMGKNGKDHNAPLWTTFTDKRGEPPYSMILEPTGNMALHGGNDEILWETQSGNVGVPYFKLKLSDDGVLTIVDATDATVWSNRQS